MSSLPQYVLYTSILAAVAAGCSSPIDQPPPGRTGTGGGSGTLEGTGGSQGSGGVFTGGTGGSAVAGTGGRATTGGASGSGVGGNVSTGGTSGMGGQTSTGGSGGGGPAPGCGNAASAKGARNLTIQVSGKARTYVLFVPSGYDATKSIPLIFAWHSSGASGAESRKYYKLEPVTGDGAIIVYPDGLNGAWDLSANGVDMKFFDLLLESISKDYCVDQARVFSTGYSFGGMMSNSLACDRGSKLRAFAPMAGAFFDGTKSCPTPVPAWMAHASNDPTVSFASGQAARDIWLKTNGCGTTTSPVSPSPCVAYQCTKAPVTWCVHTEGHEWPSFASKGVWAFFSSL
jgi:polyhydroxybutyrate depolymerase